MSLDASRIRAVVFDYGNTLIRFRREELNGYGRSLSAALERLYGPMDTDKFYALREEYRMAPYAGDPPLWKENDLPELTVRLVRELYGKTPTSEELADLLQVRFDSFVSVVNEEDHVAEVVERLREKYALGLVSNYPDGRAIRASMEKVGLASFFDSVVVSGDMGYIKPHPILFAASLQELKKTAQEVVYVGDNWLADVQGAKRVGMQMIYMKRWVPPEQFDPQPGDHLPDAEIQDLHELIPLLMDGKKSNS